MNNLAIAYVTCDKYDHIWDEWYDAFIEHWNIWDIPKYFCGEENECPFDDFKQIPHKSVEADHWTSKLRAQIEEIPEEYIFIWLDDMVQQKSITKEFNALYEWFLTHDADALRIMPRASRAKYLYVDAICDRSFYKLKRNSPYLISYHPNIYKKDFLLQILQYNESPWSSELEGSIRIRDWGKDIYAYHINGWVLNKVIQ